MGRGDKRTKRGKIFRGSFGKSRPQHAPTTADAKKIVKTDAPAATTATPVKA